MVTGLAVLSGFGRGTEPLLKQAFDGAHAFHPVRRFGTRSDHHGIAAVYEDAGPLLDELATAIDLACSTAGLDSPRHGTTPLYLAVQQDHEEYRRNTVDPHTGGARRSASVLAERCGLSAKRVYTNACTASSTAVAEAASAIAHGDTDRAVVASGYLVDPDGYGIFAAGAMSDDGHIRPFSAHRRGLLLGDAVGAIVLESQDAAQRSAAQPLARLAGWARTGDAYHMCRPHPDGTGMARAITTALTRAGVAPDAVDYVNAHGTGTVHNDAAESAALHRALGTHASQVAVSSTKSVHGHALEAAGMLELIITVLALDQGRLPVNAGFLEADDACTLNLVLNPPQTTTTPRYALSLNAAFGGANTALVVAQP
ncbi:hypothetical protein GCM10010211_32830 [Streptomyces albospinus]|uniref:Ketosynthase family 3 (KS3) domain-containing protein n=2 Tax=Streptomyces albospinus TaxID=285515 RepID=A0ABQ2V503_9ACTN|nr:hypothetical protein GCM10010211_32830 [Streptomyces albospinus]